jgi:hypothetical protein
VIGSLEIRGFKDALTAAVNHIVVRIKKLLKGQSVRIFDVGDNQRARAVLAGVVDRYAKIHTAICYVMRRPIDEIVARVYSGKVTKGSDDCPTNDVRERNLAAASCDKVLIDNPSILFQQPYGDLSIGSSGRNAKADLHVFNNAEVSSSNRLGALCSAGRRQQRALLMRLCCRIFTDILYCHRVVEAHAASRLFWMPIKYCSNTKMYGS